MTDGARKPFLSVGLLGTYTFASSWTEAIVLFTLLWVASINFDND